MNGICELRIGSSTYALRFGMIATEELTKRITEEVTDSNIKYLTDLIYCGLKNASVSKELPIMSYEEVSFLVDDLFLESDQEDQVSKIWTCFNESRHGSNWKKQIEALNSKKKEE